jgi:hypothetical protein
LSAQNIQKPSNVTLGKWSLTLPDGTEIKTENDAIPVADEYLQHSFYSKLMCHVVFTAQAASALQAIDLSKVSDV